MKIRKITKRIITLLLLNIMLAPLLVKPAYAVYTYYSDNALTGNDKKVKEWTWTAAGENDALSVPLIPSGLSQKQTALMGGYTTKFWFQNVRARVTSLNYQAQAISIDFSKFNHRYYACADSHNTGWFAPAGSQMVLKQMYFPTKNIDDYPEFIRNAPVDMETKKFILLMISMLSAAYDTPSEAELKDSDQTSMYYYLLWLSIWANDVYAHYGVFHGISPEADWEYVRDQLRVGLKNRLNPDSWGSSAIYDAFREGGPAQTYFYHCWKAAKFLSSFDYIAAVGTSLSVSAAKMQADGKFHMTFDYSGLHNYEKEVYRRLLADDLLPGWEYSNDGSRIDFKSADGEISGAAIAKLHLREASEEDRFYNCGFGFGGLAGFQGCAKGSSATDPLWGNTQVYFSAVSQPLKISVPVKPFAKDEELQVKRYQHDETWQAHYNVRLRKYDSETGQPLAGSKWDILEAFPGDQLDHTELEALDNWANRKGSQFKKWKGWDYGDGNPEGDIANDPCSWDINVTDGQGRLMLGDNEENASNHIAHNDTKLYTYSKGYCGGHPKPVIEKSGDDEVDAVNEAAAWAEWQKEVERCEALTAAGGFYHSMRPGEGKAQLKADRDKLYRQFVSLSYDYSAIEIMPRPGYTVHGSHTDDIPIEVKTVTSSEYKQRFGSCNPDFPEADFDAAINRAPSNNKSKSAATPSNATKFIGTFNDFRTKDIHSGFTSVKMRISSAELKANSAAAASPSSAVSIFATPSNTSPARAAPPDSIDKKHHLSTILNDTFELSKRLVFQSKEKKRLSDGAAEKREYSFVPSPLPPVTQGDSSIVDHTFLVYDHRTEGEIHISKRDLYLAGGEGEGYKAYGDSMGDGTLEGAVYGLFAMNDILHPDGHSGVIYQKDDLVSVTSTDRNGDASFLAFTEAPGRTWNYKTGKIESRPEEFHAPYNLHRSKRIADQIPDMENYEGHGPDGRPVHLKDSTENSGTGYWKCSSNQAGIWGLSGSFSVFPISDNELENGNCWIGRPLMVEKDGTSYYVKELTRSEGYELSVHGRSNLVTNGKTSYEGGGYSREVTLGDITLDSVKNGNYFDVAVRNHEPGRKAEQDVMLKGIDFPEGAAFGLSALKRIPEKIVAPVYSTVKKPVMASAGAFVYLNGSKVAAGLGDIVTFPGGQCHQVLTVSETSDQTIGVSPMNYHTMSIPFQKEPDSGSGLWGFQMLYNRELDRMGYREPVKGAPWLRVRLSGDTDAEWFLSIAQSMKDNDLQYFNSLRITDMEESEDGLYAVVRYEWRLYGDERDKSVYVPDKDRLYVKKDGGNGFFVYAAYDGPATNPAVVAYRMKNGFLERATLKDQKVTGLEASYPQALPSAFILKTVQTPAYWIYGEGEQQLDDSGNLKFSEETKVNYVERQGFKEVESLTRLTASYDPENQTYAAVLPASVFRETDTVSLKVYDDGSGRYSAKLAYAGKSHLSVIPVTPGMDSYLVNVTLTRPAVNQPKQDGGTRKERLEVFERPVMQKIKIIKDISVDKNGIYQDNTFARSGQKDSFTENGGGISENASYRPGFRFKAYLKSNLEQLYRNEAGDVKWQDRNGNLVDIGNYRKNYPEQVQKIYTEVLRKTEPLVGNYNHAAIANTALYGYTDGLIHEEQSPGYTAILETEFGGGRYKESNKKTVFQYNYEKFFQGIKVANQVKWVRRNSESTGFKPAALIRILLFGMEDIKRYHLSVHDKPAIENKANTSRTAAENADCPDQVRQFAVDWYLDDEVKKQVRENGAGEMEGAAGGESYPDEIYDLSLQKAIEKAKNYLKPFFTYDLDAIYAIPWDRQQKGGADGDETILSADFMNEDSHYCWGISAYLPYGTYVVTEQQPEEDSTGDFYNRHYKLDVPRELELPAVYAEETGNESETCHKLSDAYRYDANIHAPELASRFFIRFQEKDFKSGVAVMKGMRTAYDGTYGAMLVPWSVTEPVGRGENNVDFQGYGCVYFRNTFYKCRLRIEKLDSETGENILHDGAIFTVYAAKREDGETGNGRVARFENDTQIKGSREFLESMGAVSLKPAAGALSGRKELWTGVVLKNTPVCSEAQQIIMTDGEGRRTGRFEAFSTTRDGRQAEEGEILSHQNQNTGYLIMPEPLGAGTYVLCEMKPPAGYVRTPPIAVEVYSDKVSYYLEGNQDKRVAAAVYKDKKEGKEGSLTGEALTVDTARIYVENTPVRLEVSKIKTDEVTVTYQTDTRLEGTEAELNAGYGRENLEFAYQNGIYLGYAWLKGTLEYLESRRAAGEEVKPVYIGGNFAGYGLISRRLHSADEENRYVAGARLTMYDAIELKANGDSGDFSYDGVKVRRDRNHNVISIRVTEGYGGSTMEFVNRADEEGSLMEAAGDGNWTYRTVERKDTDILYYTLGGLDVLITGADGRKYGYDRDGKRVLVRNKTSIYALKNGRPAFEIVGGELEQTKYSAFDKCFSLPEGALLYHVDFQGNRESLADPVTGMAYIMKEAEDQPERQEREKKIFVWPVLVSRASGGTITAQEKRKTFRPAAIHADTAQEYSIGTFDGMNLKKKINPVLNVHGLAEYYQRSMEKYTKGEPVFDVDHDYVRYRYYEGLFAFNRNAYRINGRAELFHGGDERDPGAGKKLYHRQGEALIMENTWQSGEAYQNDPFRREMTEGRPDMIKRIFPGSYIMEEEEPPQGYLKSFPVGITVSEKAETERINMKDEKINVEIDKIDAPPEYRLDIKSDYGLEGRTTEPKGAYNYGQIKGARLALWRARRVHTADTKNRPKGYYLEKTETGPAKWTEAGPPGYLPLTVTAEWITDGSPKYFEGIPAGDYILEETEAPSGFVRCYLELEIRPVGELQPFSMRDDHTKLEIYKYYRDENGMKKPLPNSHQAKLSLYRAGTDENGNILVKDGLPQYEETGLVDSWLTDDLIDYTRIYEKKSGLIGWIKNFFGLESNRSSFILDFEAAYETKGEGFDYLTWETAGGKRSVKRISSTGTARGESAVQLWETQDRSIIRITIYRNVTNGSLNEAGRLPLNFEYQFHYRELERGIKSYDTPEGLHRIDYIPFTDEKEGEKTGNYVLVERETPQGFEPALPKAITIMETGAVQRFGLENQEKYLDVAKVIGEDGREIPLAGVTLGLYRADENGGFTKSEEYMEEMWTSGSDGVYTAADLLKGKIPEGFQVGELRVHRIHKIPYGLHYIAELETPPYVAKGPVVPVQAGQGTNNLLRVVNHPISGRLKLLKKGSDGGIPLKGARFKVSNQDTGQEWYLVTDDGGRACLSHLLPGKAGESGIIRPYTYFIEEITPPGFYQVNGGIKKFQFDGVVTEQEVTFVYEVENKPTQIRLTKRDFGSGMLLPGAILSIFRAREEGGKYITDGEAVETVTVGASGVILTGKLIAGHTYILEETTAPAGYVKAEPVLFTINETGTGAGRIAADFAVFKMDYDGNFVKSLTVMGRFPTDVYQKLRDLDTGVALNRRFRGGMECVLTGKDIVAGHLYERTEYTEYSDGNKCMSFRETRRLYLDKKGECVIPARTFLRTEERLEAGTGAFIESWEVEKASDSHKIHNPVEKEKAVAFITGKTGRGGSAVKKGDVVKYSVAYENPFDCPENVTVKAALEEGLDFMRASESGTCRNGTVTWKIEDVKPHGRGTVEIAAAVSGENMGRIQAGFLTLAGASKRTATLRNPIAPKGSVTLVNKLSGTGKNKADPFLYRIRFLDSSGKIMTGYQKYGGSLNGKIKGEGKLKLRGDEFVIFPGLPYDAGYEITQEGAEGYEAEFKKQTGTVLRAGTSAVFKNHRADQSLREVFEKNRDYLLTEMTYYSDGGHRESGRYRFHYNEAGMPADVDMEDRPVKTYFSKLDINTSLELGGGKYLLLNADTGQVIHEFTKHSGEKAEVPSGLLTPEQEYIFHEKEAPEGYCVTDDLRFQVNPEGLPETVVMEDRITQVQLLKVDAESGEVLTGGRFQIKDAENGNRLYEYEANGEPCYLNGILIAGKTYEFVELSSPPGYHSSKPVAFTVPLKPGLVTVKMEDWPTEIMIDKVTGSGSDVKNLPGCVLQILEEDKSPAGAVSSRGGFQKGEALIFTTAKQGREMKGQLVAGRSYLLHEVKPHKGYAWAEDVPFTVSKDRQKGEVVMADRPTCVEVSKTDLTGEREIPGNHLSLLDRNGVLVERWISGERPYSIFARLEAGESYRLHEELPADGFTHAADQTFTVSTDGAIDKIQMKNDRTAITIRKVSEDGQPVKGAVLQIWDERKEVVIENFITGSDPVEITGRLKAGKSYYLHEAQAPPGYLPAADISFTVPIEGKGITVTMTDIRKPDPKRNTMYLMKTDSAAGAGLKGFSFTVTGPEGKKFTVETGSDGRGEFAIPPDGIYTYRETGVRPGYLMSEETYTFAVKYGRVTGGSTVLVADQHVPDGNRRIGTITASYQKRVRESAGAVMRTHRHPSVRTGDGYPLWFVASVLALCLSCFVFMAGKKKKE